MTAERATPVTPGGARRGAMWPWLVMPLLVLAVFAVLHNVRRSGIPTDQDSRFSSGIP